MTAILAHSESQYFGLRSMDPMKDLSSVADLIEQAFANDLDRSGQNALRELRWLSRVKPVLWWMVYFSPEYTDFLSGFVWEEDGGIAGNITVNRTSVGSRRWLISNLAVAEPYQGRGIGQCLMDAAIELVRENHGYSVSLQVRGDNERAKRLYKRLGFEQISGTSYLKLGRVPRVRGIHKQPPLPKELILRPRKFNAYDSGRAHELACATIPSATQREWPIYRHKFNLGTQEKFNNFMRSVFGRGASAHWVIEDGQRLVALMDVQPGVFNQTHQLQLMVHPDWRGHLENILIWQALDYLYPWRNKDITIRHPSEHREAIEAYKFFGFKEKQTLLWMKREM